MRQQQKRSERERARQRPTCDASGKTSGQSGYWLDELHVNGQEPDWPGYPENLNRDQVVKLLADNSAKPDGFKACYKPNES